MPPRYCPGARGDVRIALSRRDVLRPRLSYAFNIFVPDPDNITVLLIQVDAIWERLLARYTELHLGAGVAISSSRAGQDEERDIYVTPATTLLAQRIPIKGHQLRLGLDTGLVH
jgi:hypothetical protein